jgi:adenylyltransferase/sulfurtransferase
MLSAAELSRYSRQLTLPEVGVAGQERLQRARVLIVGAGGLGSPAAIYLAASGVGTIGIVDSDTVEMSNLHRQILHTTRDVGRAKVESARDALADLNPGVRITTYAERLSAPRARALCAEYDLVVDGSDNYVTRYALNDACAALGVPWVYGSVERFSGQVAVFTAPTGPCYRCVFPEAPAPGSTPACDEIGVLGAVPGVIGSLQATEALKHLLGIGDAMRGRLVQLDLLRGATQVVDIEADPECPACRRGASRAADLTAAGGTNDTAHRMTDIEPVELARRITAGERPLLIDVREPWEVEGAPMDRAELIPMSELPASVDRLPRDREIVVLCHHGVRSHMVAEWLRAQGIRAVNLSGGIDRWSRDVDPAIARY